ncbi:MAG: queuosine precursor transporter [Rubrivivax sp.]
MPTNSPRLIRWPWGPVLAMAFVVALSNWAVQFPINAWLTWGAFTYPVVFLVTDLTNRTLGPVVARRVAWAGFAVAVALSLLLAPWRIALASGTAFIVAQWLDIAAFNRLRRMTWWQAPLIGSVVASLLDTALFFFLAFYGSGLDWLSLAMGDLLVKWVMAVVLLAPYRALLPRLRVWAPARGAVR